MDGFQNCFNDADKVFVTPVYTAGEEPIEGFDSESLVAGLKSRGHRSAQSVVDQDELAQAIAGDLAAGDIIVCLGAGDITRWAAALASAIDAKRGQK